MTAGISLNVLKISLYSASLAEEAEQDTCCYGRTDDTGYVRSHRVHQEVVVLVEFAADILGYTGRVRNRRYAGIADKWINLVLFLAEKIHNLCESHTADSGYYK